MAPSDAGFLVRLGRTLLWVLAGLGLLIGTVVTFTHLTSDPLADVRAYYDAGARLNAGQPLYPADADTNTAEFYRYPPLLAIAFRPLALLPYEVAAILWALAMVAAFAWTVQRIGLTSNTVLALGLLALPIGWSLAIGQAHVLTTMLVAIASPAAVALAANIKLFPILVAVYWLGRRDWRSFGRLVAWGAGLVALQFVLEPTGTLAFIGFSSLEQVGAVNNFSLYAISPILWVAAVIIGGVLALLLAPTRWGWAAAVVLSTLATPRLITYQLMGLLPALRRPDSTLPQ